MNTCEQGSFTHYSVRFRKTKKRLLPRSCSRGLASAEPLSCYVTITHHASGSLRQSSAQQTKASLQQDQEFQPFSVASLNSKAVILKCHVILKQVTGFPREKTFVE